MISIDIPRWIVGHVLLIPSPYSHNIFYFHSLKSAKSFYFIFFIPKSANYCVLIMAATDNLDERMERIRIKNEELEKKHAIAQADLKTAKEEGSLVTQKVNVEDWPKQHKYDTLEFTYDVEDKDKNQSADTLSDADKSN